MTMLIRTLVILFAVLFVVMGLRWAVDPQGAAAGLGMTLLAGVGRSSQIGDGGGMFLAMGFMMIIGLITANRTWLFAPALMLGLIAVFRVLAWLVHDAALAVDMIFVEVLVTTLLLVASRLIRRK